MYELQPEPILPHHPKAPLWRRGLAFLIDFFVALFMSSLLGGGNLAVQAVVFAIVWMISRVVVVAQNFGQSLGRWALDMRVIDTKFNRGTPGLKELTHREAIAGLGALCALIAIGSLRLTSAWALLFFFPLILDCGMAGLDREGQRAYHDQFARTRIVQTQRGYSLDLKVKRLLAHMQKRMR